MRCFLLVLLVTGVYGGWTAAGHGVECDDARAISNMMHRYVMSPDPYSLKHRLWTWFDAFAHPRDDLATLHTLGVSVSGRRVLLVGDPYQYKVMRQLSEEAKRVDLVAPGERIVERALEME